MLNHKLMGNPTEKLYSDNVFSAYPYIGNGSTQTINNGINLASKGGLVWIKERGSAQGHLLFDTARSNVSGDPFLDTSIADAQLTPTTNYLSYLTTGFNLETSSNGVNGVGKSMASWTFRKAAKFFDVVTYTGNGASDRQISHDLGIAPGLITTKATSATGDWNTYHRSATGDLKLNTAEGQTESRVLITAADVATFTVSGAANANGVQFVAYLWAHDPGEDGIVQCGSYTTVSGKATIYLGWEPHFILAKSLDGGDWRILDTMRGWSMANIDAPLIANLPNSELNQAAYGNPLSTGADMDNHGANVIYLAIRRPNKPPKKGVEVYNAIARTGVAGPTIISGVGFPSDMMFVKNLANGWGTYIIDRLRGGASSLLTVDSSAEISLAELGSFTMDGYYFDGFSTRTNNSGNNYINHFFQRATGFFDVVCDTGTGIAHPVAHSLTVAPELVIRKSRSASTQWEVWHSALTDTEKLVLNSSAAKVVDMDAWNNTAPGASFFTVGAGASVNTNGATFVTYLFATLSGISKVGSYVGNGGSQTIDCGFTTGARFILIKRTDSTGDWYVWDTARGIVADNDPHLSLNTTAAEVTTDDSVDPDVSGFIVNQNTATNTNLLNATYIFLAIA